MKMTSKWRWPQKESRHQKLTIPPKLFLPPTPLKKLPEIFWWLLTLTAKRQLMSNRICYQVSKPEMEFHMRDDICGIAHAHTNRKDKIFMQRWLGQIFTCILDWGQGTCRKSRPYPAPAYTTFVVLVWCIIGYQLPFPLTQCKFLVSNAMLPHWLGLWQPYF